MHPTITLSTGLAALLASAPLAQDKYWTRAYPYDYDTNFVSEPPVYDNLKSTHPGYEIVSVAPAGFKPKVGGMAFLPDGRLVLADWVEWGETNGNIHLLEGLEGAPGMARVSRIATGIWEPLGLAVADTGIYFLAQDGLWTLEKSAATGTWQKKPFAPFPTPMKAGGASFPLASGLHYFDGSFYYALGGYGNGAFPRNEGYVVRTGRRDRQHELISRGLRNPNGLGVSPRGAVFVTDNQGEWRRSSPIYHVERYRHMQWMSQGYSAFPPADSQQVPAIWVPQGEAGCSLTDMFHLDSGDYAGQFLVGDNRFGSVGRASLEQVGSVFQGAYYLFSGILDAGGIYRFARGADGSIYWGALGSDRNVHWMWETRTSGLLRMRRNGKPFFDLQNVRAVKDGFEIRFTESSSPDARLIARYKIHSWKYGAPHVGYGGPKEDFRSMTVTSALRSGDGRSVVLKVAGMAPGRVYRVTVDSSLASAGGRKLWTNKAWYTMNVLSKEVPTAVRSASAVSPENFAHVTVQGRRIGIRIQAAGEYAVEVHDARGRLLHRSRGLGAGMHEIPMDRGGLWWVKVGQGGRSMVRRLHGI